MQRCDTAFLGISRGIALPNAFLIPIVFPDVDLWTLVAIYGWYPIIWARNEISIYRGWAGLLWFWTIWATKNGHNLFFTCWSLGIGRWTTDRNLGTYLQFASWSIFICCPCFEPWFSSLSSSFFFLVTPLDFLFTWFKHSPPKKRKTNKPKNLQRPYFHSKLSQLTTANHAADRYWVLGIFRNILYVQTHTDIVAIWRCTAEKAQKSGP